ncbi:MAG: chromosomal replication initiator protein DnaA [Prevotella sp.]|nr:chromosomal replication initiator protein DnaA [Prevotella sp.]
MKIKPQTLWEQCLFLIKENVSEQQYKTWFKPLVFETYNPSTKTLLVQVPSALVYEYLEEHYVDLLKKVLVRVFGNGVLLSYRVVIDKTNNLTQDFESEKEDGVMPKVSRNNVNQSPTILDSVKPDLDPQLNPQQTFASFIEGESNKLPRALGLSIAENPNTTQFNPMFIFGPSGCGKTHLINAIGVKIKQLYPQKRVLYISARLFQVQYTNAVRQNTVNDFINFYQSIDVLIIDDVQEWMTAKSTQDTFFHIFNHLFRNGKRIVLASDRPPVDLKGMNERLITRFACGLIAELESPDEQLRVDVLRSLVHREGLDIPEDVIQFIACTAKGCVRDLKGVVNSLLAYSVVYNSNIDMRLAERVIKRAVKVDNHPLTIDDIIEKVCNHYNVTANEVNSKSRKRELVVARQVSMYLAQKYTKMPTSRIGKLIGGRDHSTVLHSCTQVSERLKIDKSFSNEISSIENSFRLKK